MTPLSDRRNAEAERKETLTVNNQDVQRSSFVSEIKFQESSWELELLELSIALFPFFFFNEFRTEHCAYIVHHRVFKFYL